MQPLDLKEKGMSFTAGPAYRDEGELSTHMDVYIKSSQFAAQSDGC